MLKVLKGLLLGGISHVGARTWTYTQETENALFKTAYGKHNAMAFNQRSALYGRIKKKTNFKGKDMVPSIRLSYGGGRGSGKLPRASRALYKQITLKTKKLYHRLSIDNETFEASKSSLGAFVNMAKEPMEVARIAFSNLLERQIVLGDLTGSGLLMTSPASSRSAATTVTSPFELEMTAGDIAESLEEGDVCDLVYGSNTLVAEVTKVTEGATPEVTFKRLDGASAAIAATAKVDVYLQNSKDAELEGLHGVLKATSGTYKGIAIGRRWQSYQDTTSGALTKARLNKAVLQIVKRCGEVPTVIVVNHKQYTTILDLFEDIKRVQIPARGKALKAQVGYAALEYVSPQGTIPIVFNRYVKEGDLYLLNEDKIELVSRAAPQWFNRDGTVFLRETDEDTYEARYGCFSDLFIQPFYQGVITGLT